MNSIILFSLKHRLLIIIAAVLLLVGGSYTAMKMEVDVFPDLNAPTVVVMTEAKGMAAEEVERLVTFPIEMAVNGATNVRRVRSSSTTGFSVVWVEFDWGTDIYIARQIASEKITALSETLPPTVGSPTLGPQSSILGEVMFISMTSKKTSLLDLRTIADWTVRPRLLSTGGVAQVTVLGGDIKEYAIKLHTDKMSHYGVTIDQVVQATKSMTQNASGGVFYEYGNEYIVRGMVATNKLEELRRTLIEKIDGQPIMLDDIADVEIEGKSPKMGLASVDGKPAILLTITKQPNVGTIELTEQLDKAIDDLRQNLPKDIEIRTDLYRQQRFIDSSIGNIRQSLIEGAFFVVIVLFLFLMNVRTTFISLITIPLALLTAILTLRFFGMTINTMSIGGMAIAIGSLVDDAIVDVENVFKRLRQNVGSGKPVLQVVYEASKEVRVPILSSTLIIVVSFIPLFFLDGMEGRMLVPLGVAFIVSLFASTAVALTVTPVLSSLLLAKGTQNSKVKTQNSNSDPFLVRWLKKGYAVLLGFVLNHKNTTIFALAAVLAYAVVCFTQLGHSFLPPFNEGSLTINVSTFPGVSLEESDRIGQMAEQALLKVDGITAVARKTGRAELDEHALGVNVSEIEAILNTESRSKKEIIRDIRQQLSVLSGVNIEIGQPISHRIDAMLSGTQANIAIKVFGPDLNRLYNIGTQIKKTCADIPGIVDLNVEQQVERPQLSIVPRREMLARYGITIPEFTEFINVLLGGEVVSQVFEGNKAFDLTLRTDDVSERTMETICQTKIDTKDDEKIPLEYVADIYSTAGPNTINRENVSRKLVVSANVEGRDLGSVVEDIRAKVSQEISLPDDYHVEYGGQFESEQSARQTLIVLSCVAILIIFLLLYQQFNSSVQALVILLNLPLALIGGVFALKLTGGVLSIPAIIGFISLFGIATRNGMLLVDKYNALRNDVGADLVSARRLRDIIIAGSLDRLNPIIMTALTSALALIPLALGGDLPGNEIQSPMAKVMLGGLISSTILNAFIVPVMVMKITTPPKPSPQGGGVNKKCPFKMKNRLLHIFFFSLPLWGGTEWGAASAQSFSTILETVVRNNAGLRASRYSAEAQKEQGRVGLTLADPEIEVGYLFGSPREDVNDRKDISVTQQFDWAILSGDKRRVAEAEALLLDRNIDEEVRQLKEDAALLLTEITYYNKVLQELHRRKSAEERLLNVYQTMMDKGDGTILDVNKAKLSLAQVCGQITKTEVEREGKLLELRGLAQDNTLIFGDTLYAVSSLALPKDFDAWAAGNLQNTPLVRIEDQQVAVSKAQADLARSETKPSFSLGYTSELVKGSNYRGVALGVSVPLWANRNKTKAAQKAQLAAEEQRLATEIAQKNKYRQLFSQAKAQQRVAEEYRSALQSIDNNAILDKALSAGQMSLTEYLIEKKYYYENYDQWLEAERDAALATVALLFVK